MAILLILFFSIINLYFPLHIQALGSSRSFLGRVSISLPNFEDYKPYPMPVPSRTYPFPTSPKPWPTRIIPSNKLGSVSLSARVTACGHKYPYSGSFTFCRNKVEYPDASNNLQQSNGVSSCQSLMTDSKGEGQLKLVSGHYAVKPPSFCPPGYFCLMNEAKSAQSVIGEPKITGSNIRPLMVYPYSWQIEPTNFFLTPDSEVIVKATGFNNLLMCPIQADQ